MAEPLPRTMNRSASFLRTMYWGGMKSVMPRHARGLTVKFGQTHQTTTLGWAIAKLQSSATPSMVFPDCRPAMTTRNRAGLRWTRACFSHGVYWRTWYCGRLAASELRFGTGAKLAPRGGRSVLDEAERGLRVTLVGDGEG